jgi:hypothetical protein
MLDKLEPEPHKNRPVPQHCLEDEVIRFLYEMKIFIQSCNSSLKKRSPS